MLKKTITFLISVCILLVIPQYLVTAEGKYSKVRESLLLSPEFKSRITHSEDLKQLPEFQELIKDKIQLMPKVFLHYAYSSEGVDDTEWGCAWRGIQTILSSVYQGDSAKVPTFKNLYEQFGSRDFLKEQLELHYGPIADDQWLAPHEEWHMWADPIVGQMIIQSLGVKHLLVSLNRQPESLMPQISDVTLDFVDLQKLILAHFSKGGHPLLIDNGKYALNILGAGVNEGHFYLLIGDPHLNFERDEHPLNGIYTVEIDQKGSQVAIDYPAAYNHFDPDSFKTLQFTKETRWNLLFSR